MQCFKRRFDEIDRIIRPVTLRQNVVDSARFTNGSNRRTGNHSSTGPGGNQDHLRRTISTFYGMRNRPTIQGNGLHILRTVLHGLLDSRRNFIRFSISATNTAFTVANNDHRRKTKSAATLDHCRTSSDLHDLVDQISSRRIATHNTIARLNVCC